MYIYIGKTPFSYSVHCFVPLPYNNMKRVKNAKEKGMLKRKYQLCTDEDSDSDLNDPPYIGRKNSTTSVSGTIDNNRKCRSSSRIAALIPCSSAAADSQLRESPGSPSWSPSPISSPRASSSAVAELEMDMDRTPYMASTAGPRTSGASPVPVYIGHSRMSTSGTGYHSSSPHTINTDAVAISYHPPVQSRSSLSFRPSPSYEVPTSVYTYPSGTQETDDIQSFQHISERIVLIMRTLNGDEQDNQDALVANIEQLRARKQVKNIYTVTRFSYLFLQRDNLERGYGMFIHNEYT